MTETLIKIENLRESTSRLKEGKLSLSLVLQEAGNLPCSAL